ncbi:MAG: 50S ribosomal protein L10 [Dehalococcoidia bacterium]|nr:50S ribosomal protein L10 [Chloroflexota bacterium]MBT9159099.1 50S ribosomal protein L10 [Chloroflexota bacterium]MBT9161500.1 50S ribosomal protein L10 [Chloroflexota bacterium]
MVRKEKKAELVDLIREKLVQAEIVIATDHRGLTVAKISGLRNKLRQQGVEYRVVKNTLAGFAATAAGKPDLSRLLTGPTALAFGYDDVIQPAKSLLDYQRSAETTLIIKGGMLAGKLLTAEDIVALAKLPPKDELIARFVGLVQSPVNRLLITLNGNLQSLMGVLQARIRQFEGG